MDSATLQLFIAVGQVILTAIAGLFGWLLHGLFATIKELKQADRELSEKVGDLRVLLPSNYVSKSDFKEMGDSIFGALRRIEDKLDQKADR